MSVCSRLKNVLNLVHHRLRRNIHYVEGTSLSEDAAKSVVLTGKKGRWKCNQQAWSVSLENTCTLKNSLYFMQ